MFLKQTILAGIFAAICAVQDAGAATAIYTDQAAFAAASVGPLSLEDFNDGTVDFGITIDTTSDGFVNVDEWWDRPRNGGGTRGRSTIFSFGHAVTSFGGDYDLTLNGVGNGLSFTLSTGEVVATELTGAYTGFWGFVSDTAFSSVTVGIGSLRGNAETYSLDNLRFTAALVASAPPVAPVPLPAGLPLLLVALFGLFGLRRMRARAMT